MMSVLFKFIEMQSAARIGCFLYAWDNAYLHIVGWVFYKCQVLLVDVLYIFYQLSVYLLYTDLRI